MNTDLARVLERAYQRLKCISDTPTDFAASYALCLGIIMGGEACGAMSASEVQEERGRIGMLAVIYEASQPPSGDTPGADPANGSSPGGPPRGDPPSQSPDTRPIFRLPPPL
jgi:hypothetical protein